MDGWMDERGRTPAREGTWVGGRPVRRSGDGVSGRLRASARTRARRQQRARETRSSAPARPRSSARARPSAPVRAPSASPPRPQDELKSDLGMSKLGSRRRFARTLCAVMPGCRNPRRADAVAAWSAAEVSDWLQSIGMGKYAKAFAKHEVRARDR